jgi:CheY-like chemotaxis protein
MFVRVDLGNPRRDGTVLLVEPDPGTRSLAAFMLGRLGYRVLEAHNAAEAMELYSEESAPIDLLLTAAVMSRVNGHDLAEQIRARQPGLRTLFLAEPKYEKVSRRVPERKGVRFLCCPFTMASLSAKVQEALAPGGRTAAAS